MTAITSNSTVRDAMTPDPVIVSVDCSLTEVAELLDFHAISGLPVLDWSGYLVGVVSQTDIVRAQADPDLSARWSRLAVRDVMSRPALTVSPSVSLEQAARIMAEHHVHRLVVMTENDEEPVGVLSSSDVVRSVAESGEDEDPSCTPALLSIELS